MNHLEEFNDSNIYDIFLDMDIDLKSEDYQTKLFDAIDEYIHERQFSQKRN